MAMGGGSGESSSKANNAPAGKSDARTASSAGGSERRDFRGRGASAASAARFAVWVAGMEGSGSEEALPGEEMFAAIHRSMLLRASASAAFADLLLPPMLTEAPRGEHLQAC